jgi:hypothetical protein
MPIGFRMSKGGVLLRQPVFNSADKDSDGTLSDDDRSAAFSAQGGVRSTFSIDGQSRYVEALLLNGAGNNAWRFGVATSAHTITAAPGSSAVSWCIRGGGTSSIITNNTITTPWGTGLSDSGDVLMMAVSAGGKIWWGRAGTWFESGDPGADSNPAYTGLTGPLFILFGAASGSPRNTTLKLLADYSYSPPAGFQKGW